MGGLGLLGFFSLLAAPQGIRGLVLVPDQGPNPHALHQQHSLNHWTTRKVREQMVYNQCAQAAAEEVTAVCVRVVCGVCVCLTAARAQEPQRSSTQREPEHPDPGF